MGRVASVEHLSQSVLFIAWLISAIALKNIFVYFKFYSSLQFFRHAALVLRAARESTWEMAVASKEEKAVIRWNKASFSHRFTAVIFCMCVYSTNENE